MGERFYLAQLAATGDCPGRPNKRRKRVAWTDEQKAQAISMYEEANPTPETSMEIVKEIADEMGVTPNGVRMILTKANVYVKKSQPAKGEAKASGGTRISKEEAHADLKGAIQDAGQEIDEDIISKLTGKAAVYFTGVINNINQ